MNDGIAFSAPTTGSETDLEITDDAVWHAGQGRGHEGEDIPVNSDEASAERATLTTGSMQQVEDGPAH